MRIFIILATLLAALGTARAQGAGDDPVAFMRSVYAAYARAEQQKAPYIYDRKVNGQYFSAGLKKLADEEQAYYENNSDEVGFFNGGDMLHDAQDREIKNFKLALASRQDGKAVVRATFRNFGEARTIDFELVREPGGWRIDDVVYIRKAERRRLRTELEAVLKEVRAAQSKPG